MRKKKASEGGEYPLENARPADRKKRDTSQNQIEPKTISAQVTAGALQSFSVVCAACA
jgi:hypothetical protein